MPIDRRPGEDEYAEYYGRYVSRVPEGDVLGILSNQCRETVELLSGLDETVAGSAYAPGKWTLKEVLGHVVDAEWVFTYRALTFARADPTELPGMEQDDWAGNSNHTDRSLSDILAEFRALRAASTTLFGSLTDRELDRTGIASGNRLSVRAVPYILAGHEHHHVEVLKQKYLTSA